jgi:NDP-sugar pyrophosphorylase family protein
MKRTIEDILKLFPNTTEADWTQHANGGGWKQTTAEVADTALVEGVVSGYALVSDEARVSDNAVVYGNALVSGNARVSDNALVCGKARVFGNAVVFGNAWVSGGALVYGNASVYGNARVFGNAQVYGHAWVTGDAWETSPLYIQGSKHAATNAKYGHIAIGCEVHTFAEWQEQFQIIGEANGYTEAEIAEYKMIIDLFCKLGK